MDLSNMSLAEVESQMLKVKARVAKQLAHIDKALFLIGSTPDKPKPNGKMVIHSIKRVRATFTSAGARKAIGRDGRRLQGLYMGAVRHLTVSQKQKVKAEKLANGYHAAIKMAKALRG